MPETDLFPFFFFQNFCLGVNEALYLPFYMRPDRVQYTNIYLPPRKLIGLTRREPWQLNGAVLHLSPQQKLPSASRLEAATVWAPGRKVVPLHYMADRFSRLSTLNSQGRIFWGQFEQKSEIGYRIFLNCYHLQPKEHDSRSGNLPRSDPSTRKALTYWSESRGGRHEGQELEDGAEVEGWECWIWFISRRGIPSAVCNCTVGLYREDKTQIFLKPYMKGKR